MRREAAIALLLLAGLTAGGCGKNAQSAGGVEDTDSETMTSADDTDSETVIDTDIDTGTDTGTDTVSEPECTENADCEDQELICNAAWGICVVADCAGQDDFTPCEVVTVPDRSFDICVEEVCVSPGCGDETCNTPGPHFPLADTNQRLCYDNVAQIDCPAPGQDFHGQDAQYGWDASNDPEDRYTRDLSVASQPVVMDNVTGLVWQGCAHGTTGDDCTGSSATEMPWSDQLANCDSLVWGGHADWRLPDRYELQSIVDYGKGSAPVFDANAFPNSPGYYFWSSSTCAANPSDAWHVYFGITDSGGEVHWYHKMYSFHARCVRGGPLEGRRLEPSVLSGDRVVEDTVTGLVWQGCSRGQSGESCAGDATTGNWRETLSYCEGLSWGGYSDWRLPSVSELQSLVDNRRTSEPFIDVVAFPNTPSWRFWSSSSSSFIVSDAWRVQFETGAVLVPTKVSNNHARCVRDGP